METVGTLVGARRAEDNVMLGLLLKKILRYLSVHFLYLKWIRTAAAALVLGMTYLIDSGWFAQACLTVVLIGLLIGGILLLTVGLRDLARDFWDFLHPRPH
jgi:hypothetical protein